MQQSLAGHSQAHANADGTRYKVLGAISFSHFLNDMIQSLIIAIYPLLKGEFDLSFAQIGMISLTYQICASVLQPLVGTYTDRHPQPHSLSAGMGFTLAGLLALGLAQSYAAILVAAALVGAGSAVFHPESSRIARLASGGRHGLAQSIFQVGGSAGSAAGPLLAAWIIIPHGRSSVSWFALAAILAIVILWNVSGWYVRHHLARTGTAGAETAVPSPVSSTRVAWSLAILRGVGFLEIFLPGRDLELLQLFPDREIPRLHPGRAGVSVPFPARERARHPHRRPARRPDRTQAGHLVLDPRGGSLHARASPCGFGIDCAV